MPFGIILLVLIAALSAAGSVIEQGQSVSYYAEAYKSFHGVILMLGLNNIFESWYFAVLLGLLCINLVLCSIVRITNVVKSGRKALEKAAALPDIVLLTPEGAQKLREHMDGTRCRAEKIGGCTVYSKNSAGRYGTFITHLAILLTVIFGAAALYLPEVIDESCYPGESVALSDGTKVCVDSFHIENAEGQLDYASTIHVNCANGDQSGETEISVNHPFSYKEYKVYQQTYGTAGSITVTDSASGASDDFTLDEMSFLSADGVNGVWYEALYPGYVEDENGEMTLITSTSGSYEDPVYQLLIASDGEYTPVLAFPGESVSVAGLTFTVNDPIEYPGLRIKFTPVIVNVLLVAAFVLMIGGLYITFFMQPVLVKTDENGYTVTGPKPEPMRLELRLLLEGLEKEE